MNETTKLKIITALGIGILTATVVFTGVPVILDFILIYNEKKKDYSFTHDHIVLGVGFVSGLLLVLSPNTIVNLVNRFAANKLPKDDLK